MNDNPTNIGVTCGQHDDVSTVARFIDQDQPYTSAATQIPHHVQKDPISYGGRKFSTRNRNRQFPVAQVHPIKL